MRSRRFQDSNRMAITNLCSKRAKVSRSDLLAKCGMALAEGSCRDAFHLPVELASEEAA